MSLARMAAERHPSEKSEEIYAPLKNVGGLGDWEPWIVRMDNLTDRIIDPSDLLNRVRQVWLTGYYVRNANSETLRVNIDSPNFDVRNTIINDSQGGTALFLEEAISQAGNRVRLESPQPLFGPHMTTNRIGRFRFSVTDWDGNAVTYDRLTLHFALQVAEPDQSTTSNMVLLPFTPMYRQGANAF